jgi:hypothetical protein
LAYSLAVRRVPIYGSRVWDLNEQGWRSSRLDAEGGREK